MGPGPTGSNRKTRGEGLESKTCVFTGACFRGLLFEQLIRNSSRRIWNKTPRSLIMAHVNYADFKENRLVLGGGGRE